MLGLRRRMIPRVRNREGGKQRHPLLRGKERKRGENVGFDWGGKGKDKYI